MSQADTMITHENHQGTKPTQVLKCTQRGCKTRFTTNKPTNPERVISQARQKGWNINLANKTAICTKHGKDLPREMTPDDRRRIFREIDDCYDKKSYVAGATDKSIGLKFDLPWAWVKTIREENFGPEGHDPRLVKLMSHIADHEGRVKKMEELGYKVIEEADKLSAEIVTAKANLAELMRRS